MGVDKKTQEKLLEMHYTCMHDRLSHFSLNRHDIDRNWREYLKNIRLPLFNTDSKTIQLITIFVNLGLFGILRQLQI